MFQSLPTLLVVALATAGFAVFWLILGYALCAVSGWFRLQKRYAAELRPGALSPVRESVRLGSAYVGPIRYNNVLRVSARPEGLGLSVLRLMGPFQKPLLIPWTDVKSRSDGKRFLLGAMVRVDLGQPPRGRLTLREQDWRRIEDAAPANALRPSPRRPA